MPTKPDDYKKPTTFIQVAAFVTFVALAFIDSKSPDFQVSVIVYWIIGGVLLGVTDIIRLIKGVFGGKQ